MGKRKRTNGCLLSILKMAIVSSFIVLMSFFGLYILTTSLGDDMTKTGSQEVEVATTRSIDKKQVPVAEEPTHQRPAVILEEEQEIGSNQVGEEKSSVGKPLQQTVEEVVQEEETLPPYAEDQLMIESEEKINVQENLKVGNEEELQSESDIEPDNKVDIPVYNRYELTLSDYVITEAEDVLTAGEVNVADLVGQYFSNMSTREKLRLINMLLGKMKNIDVSYVWGMVADGITEEDVYVLQSLIEDNFTEEEIDELYMYYVKSELAQLE